MRRFAREETGVALGLAVMLVALVGVLGAGLLTLVVTDLGAVRESNRGQRAFALADAGVRIARRQLTSDSLPGHYDGSGADEIQWSSSAHTSCGEAGGRGICLRDLDGSPATADRVNISIRSTSDTSFEVVSTGQYGGALRRIEAVFRKVSRGGMRAYYTPGDIRLQGSVEISGVSFFAGGDLIQPNGSPGSLRKDYESAGPPLVVGEGVDALGDWKMEPWNAVGRTLGGEPFRGAGFAAGGRICGDPACKTSVADGLYAYDSTTGDRGNRLAFAGNAGPEESGPERVISYPFSPLPPAGERLRRIAGDRGSYYRGTSPPWGVLYGATEGRDRVVFVDAEGTDVTISGIPGGQARGVLAVRCAETVALKQEFEGIVLVLRGREKRCAGARAGFRNEGRELRGYVYADGGIELAAGSGALALPPGKGELLEAVSGPGALELVSWRELYK